MATGLSTKNKLHVSWSDSSFIPWLNHTTVLDYFCDPRNPFYNSECNNQVLKMQGIGPGQTAEKITTMIGFEYQLYSAQPPLYVIRKVQRTSPKEVIPMTYYYILHGVVYQAPDLMTVISSRLQMSSYYLGEALENAFSHYVYNPTRGYHWDFNQTEETSKKESFQQKSTPFQRERVDLLIQEFVNRFPPFTIQEPQTKTEAEIKEENAANPVVNKEDQPAEKKMKLNN